VPGHLWTVTCVLSRDLASQGHYPAVDFLNSVSRLMPEFALKGIRRSRPGSVGVGDGEGCGRTLLAIGA
jgi:vacuolar-type H+-ATPase subunit B/Vma2